VAFVPVGIAEEWLKLLGFFAVCGQPQATAAKWTSLPSDSAAQSLTCADAGCGPP